MQLCKSTNEESKQENIFSHDKFELFVSAHNDGQMMVYPTTTSIPDTIVVAFQPCSASSSRV